MWFKTLLIVATLATPTLVSGTIYDCWDREKLQRMSFGSNGLLMILTFKFDYCLTFSDFEGKKEDPGLDQFIKMVNCLSSQQGQGSGSNLDHDWRQWSNMAGSGAKYPPGPGWNNPSNPVNQNQWPSNTYNRNPPVQPVPGVPGSIPGVPGAVPGVPGLPNVPGMPGVSGNPGVVGGVGGVGGPGMQPQPGVHPDDWSQRGEGRKRNRNRENRRNKDENRRRLQEETIADLNQPPVGQRYDQATWNNPNPINPLDVPNTFVNPEVETSAVTLSRKYGYAIMALSVVVLAVLMVSQSDQLGGKRFYFPISFRLPPFSVAIPPIRP